MPKILKLLYPWITIGLIYHLTLNVQAETAVTKAQLPYEVLSINIEGDNLHISGWALAAYVQHFDSYLDHGVDLEFISAVDSFRISAYSNGISQTSTMEYFGSPTCAYGIYNQIPEICNYHYNNVGFDAYIPLSQFKAGTTYQTNIIVHAYNAQTAYVTPLYYPLQNDLVITSPSKEFRIISRLDDTVLTVSATTVLARKEPYKSSPIWYSGFSCSITYSNQLFFLVNTTYKNVFEKAVSDNTSFYKVSANLFICSANRRRIVEGTNITPVWIASPYVLYSGSPLQIQVTQLNQTPVLTVHNTEIFEGDSFNYRDHISAIDAEDGDLTNQITLISTNYTSSIGSYYFDLSVCDSQSACTTNRLWVLVKEIPNNIPNIYAEDIKLLLNTNYDFIAHANAYDIEDGDLTNKIFLLNNINTSLLGNQLLCYGVYDSKNAYVEKCINVSIIDYETYVNQFRFISKNFLFYQEDIPSLWINNMQILQDALNNEAYLFKITLN